MDFFVSGPRGSYNTRFIRRMFNVCHKGKWVPQAEMDGESETVELYAEPSALCEMIIPGSGIARVVHWIWDEIPVTDEDVTEECLSWTVTNIIGWRIDATGDEFHSAILVDPPTSNGAYVVQEPNGEFVSMGDTRLSEGELTSWALALARAAARHDRRKMGEGKK